MTDTVAASEADSLQAQARHPMDPEPVRSTKAAAVLALGVAAVVTGPMVGGVVPEARQDIVAGRGYLTGARQLRVGLTLAWIGIALAVTALVVASVIGLISLANGGGQDFPDTTN
jgi:hypothetical protein